MAVEVFPFKKMAWRTAEIEAKWEPFRRRIYNAVNFAEYESVKRGLRSCDVYQLDPHKFDWQVNKVFLDELHYLSILRSKQYGGYGHRHYNTDTIDSDTFIYGCVCKTLPETILFHDAGVVDVSKRINEYPTEGIDHTTTGKLLGYPECFPLGTKIPTPNGIKNIENIGKNELLIDGSIVSSVMKRPYNGKLISIKVQGLPEIRMTPNHEVLVCRSHTGEKWGVLKSPQWMRAEKLTTKDRVLIKKIKFPTRKIYINFDEYLKIHKTEEGWKYVGGNNDGALVKSSKTLPNICGMFEFDKWFARLMGWYLAEGNASEKKATVTFSLGTEKEAQEVLSLIIRVFNMRVPIIKKRTAYIINVYSVALARFFLTLGHKAPNKRLPSFVWNLEEEILDSLIQGFVDGDGWETEDKIVIHITSEKIVKELQLLLLLKWGLFSSYVKRAVAGRGTIENREVNMSDAHVLSFLKNPKNKFYMENEEYFALKIKTTKITDYVGLVYNFETDTAVYGVPFIVHNCCIEFFNSTWLKDGCLDPMYETAVATKDVEQVGVYHVKVVGEPSLNRLMRYWGFNVIPFFPHSFDCEKAVKFGEWWFELMLEYDREASEACMAILSMPMRWSLQNCITYVEHPLFIGSANGYYTEEPRIVEWFPND